MQADLGIALQLMLSGMGVTFGAILLLWGLMALLARLTTEQPIVEPVVPVTSGQVEETRDRRRRAAIAAVAVALARRRVADRVMPPPVMVVSPWQAVRRVSRFSPQGREQP